MARQRRELHLLPSPPPPPAIPFQPPALAFQCWADNSGTMRIAREHIARLRASRPWRVLAKTKGLSWSLKLLGRRWPRKEPACTIQYDCGSQRSVSTMSSIPVRRLSATLPVAVLAHVSMGLSCKNRGWPSTRPASLPPSWPPSPPQGGWHDLLPCQSPLVIILVLVVFCALDLSLLLGYVLRCVGSLLVRWCDLETHIAVPLLADTTIARSDGLFP